jgi:hypothetical protein
MEITGTALCGWADAKLGGKPALPGMLSAGPAERAIRNHGTRARSSRKGHRTVSYAVGRISFE